MSLTGAPNEVYPDVGVGMFYYKKIEEGTLANNTFYAGISMPQVFGLASEQDITNSNYDISSSPKYYGMVGWHKRLANNSTLETMIWIRHIADLPTQLDWMVRYQFKTKFWLGTGLSSSKILHAEAGFNLGKIVNWNNNLTFGYSFDYSFGNKYSPSFGQTHEINLGYLLFSKDKEIPSTTGETKF